MKQSELKQKQELINEAKDLAFFADQPLTQEILDNIDNLRDYIERHEKKLIERKVISSKAEAPELSSEILKKRRSWFQKLVTKSVYFPILIFMFITALVLMNNGFELQREMVERLYLLVPASERWVNISPEFREKMIIVYLSFYLILSVILFSTFRQLWVYRVEFFGSRFIPLKNGICNKSAFVVIAMIFLLGMCALIFFTPITLGSETFLSNSELDNSSRRYIFREEFMWNDAFGIIFHKSMYLLSIGYFVLLCAHTIGNSRWCSKYK